MIRKDGVAFSESVISVKATSRHLVISPENLGTRAHWRRLVGYLLPIRGKRSTGKMSMLSAAALLDELMGVDRDRAPNEKKTALHWSDPQVIFGYFYSSLLLVICLVRFVDKTNADSKLLSFTFQVCKYFLCGFCPSQLFVNTRSDLG